MHGLKAETRVTHGKTLRKAIIGYKFAHKGGLGKSKVEVQYKCVNYN